MAFPGLACMIKLHTYFVVGLSALALSACDQSAGDSASAGDNGTSPPAQAPAETSSPSPADSNSPPPGYGDGSGINDNYPDLSRTPLTPEAERSETGARSLLGTFARAIELREYDQAWDLLGSELKQGWTKPRFNDVFDGLSQITVKVPDGETNGAAGSSYYNVRIEILASDEDGRPIAIEAPMVLRRVNDVPGATPEQLRWQITHFDPVVTH